MIATTELEVIECPNCGIQFAAPRWFLEKRRSGELSARPHLYCPNGHQLSWKETELDRVRRERDRLAQQNARLDEERLAAERRATEERKKRQRIEKRTSAGTCPCCNRTFSQLARHMQTKHPEMPFVPAVKRVARVRGGSRG